MWEAGITVSTTPIIHILYDDMITWDYSWLTLKLWVCARQIDGLTDRWTIRPSNGDVKMHLQGLVFLLWHYFARIRWFPLFLAIAWQTDRRTGYGDARTYSELPLQRLRLKKKPFSNNICNCPHGAFSFIIMAITTFHSKDKFHLVPWKTSERELTASKNL